MQIMYTCATYTVHVHVLVGEVPGKSDGCKQGSDFLSSIWCVFVGYMCMWVYGIQEEGAVKNKGGGGISVKISCISN